MFRQPQSERSTTLLHRVGSLRQIAQALSTVTDLDTTLDLIARTTADVMAVDSCTLYLLEPDNVTLRLRATTGLGRSTLGYATLRIGEGMTGTAVAENRPIFASVARTHPDFKLVDESESALQSLLAVPLVIRNRPLGGLNVQTFEARDFSTDEIELLQLIADLAAGALVKARLHDEQQAQLADLRALAQVSAAVTSPQYLDDMLDIVTDMAARTMNAAVCSLFLLDETGTQLEVRSAKWLTSPYRPRSPIAVGEGIMGLVAQTGRLVSIADLAQEPRFSNRDLARAEGLVSLLAVPLTVRERVIGVLACYTDEARDFTDKQVALFSTLANQTALAIENARLVTHAAVVREMHHRIKNNLQTVAMLMQLQIPDAARLDTREVLEANIHRIRSIATVHEVLSEKGFQLVDVRDVLERIARATVQTVDVPGRSIAIEVLGDSLPLPSQAATALALIVNELVQNAVEHAFAGRQRGEVRISLGRTAEQIYVWVRDNGNGVPADMTHGLGLEIAHALASDDLRGALSFRRLEQGTEAEICMPRSVEQLNH